MTLERVYADDADPNWSVVLIPYHYRNEGQFLAVTEWLSCRSRAGYYSHKARPPRDRVFCFSEPDVAFEFKMRFG